MANGLVEKSIFWPERVVLPDGRVVVVWCKARPDTLPLDCNMISDLKSCDNAGPAATRRAIGGNGYHQQLALGGRGIRVTTGRIITDYVLVFIASKRPHSINIKPVSGEAIDYGARQNLRALRRFAQAWADNEWPGYDDDEVTAQLPDHMAKRLAWESEKGLLPPLDFDEETGAEAF